VYVQPREEIERRGFFFGLNQPPPNPILRAP
jgi:hypothetical protein